jgi:hypothetical protein
MNARTCRDWVSRPGQGMGRVGTGCRDPLAHFAMLPMRTYTKSDADRRERLAPMLIVCLPGTAHHQPRCVSHEVNGRRGWPEGWLSGSAPSPAGTRRRIRCLQEKTAVGRKACDITESRGCSRCALLADLVKDRCRYWDQLSIASRVRSSVDVRSHVMGSVPNLTAEPMR